MALTGSTLEVRPEFLNKIYRQYDIATKNPPLNPLELDFDFGSEDGQAAVAEAYGDSLPHTVTTELRVPLYGKEMATIFGQYMPTFLQDYIDIVWEPYETWHGTIAQVTQAQAGLEVTPGPDLTVSKKFKKIAEATDKSPWLWGVVFGVVAVVAPSNEKMTHDKYMKDAERARAIGQFGLADINKKVGHEESFHLGINGTTAREVWPQLSRLQQTVARQAIMRSKPVGVHTQAHAVQFGATTTQTLGDSDPEAMCRAVQQVAEGIFYGSRADDLRLKPYVLKGVKKCIDAYKEALEEEPVAA